MKKTIWLLLCAVVLLSLGGCGKAAPEPPAATPSPVAESTPAVDTPAPTSTPEPQPEPEKEQLAVAQSASLRFSLFALNPNADFSLGRTNGAGSAALLQWLCSETCLALLESVGSEHGASAYAREETLSPYEGDIAPAEEERYLRLGAPGSASELLQRALPPFEYQYGYTVEVMTGTEDDLIALARYGGVDVLLLPEGEKQKTFVSLGLTSPVSGFDTAEVPFLCISYYLCAPESDPLALADCADLAAAVQLLAQSGVDLYVESGIPVPPLEAENWEPQRLSDLSDDPLTAMQTARDDGLYILVPAAVWLSY